MRKSFSNRLRAGESPDELRTYYALNPSEYQRVVSSMQDIKNRQTN
jgi:hypothetical protein